jgi:pescadillo protein
MFARWLGWLSLIFSKAWAAWICDAVISHSPGQVLYLPHSFNILAQPPPTVPSRSLPPHLSPFVDNEAEGYLPEYAEQIQRLRDAHQGSFGGVLPLPGGAEETLEEGAAAKAAAERGEDLAAAAKAAEVARLEQEYLEDLRKEVAGVPFSASGRGGEESGEEEEGRSGKVADGAKEEDDEKAMERIMMPRKTKKLYEAMQVRKRELCGSFTE